MRMTVPTLFVVLASAFWFGCSGKSANASRPETPLTAVAAAPAAPEVQPAPLKGDDMAAKSLIKRIEIQYCNS
ncbi:MAG: hypothetical protein ABIF71_05795 [Planctomycetota bacterium]